MRIEHDSSGLGLVLPLWYNEFQPVYSLTNSVETYVNMHLSIVSFRIKDWAEHREKQFTPWIGQDAGTNEEIILLCSFLFLLL